MRRSDADDSAPLWHPNFRDFEKLPDTKVVRTAFFINAASIVVALALLIWVGYREYHLHEIRQQLADAQDDIEKNQKQSREAIERSKSFAEQEKKIDEVAAFLARPVLPTETILLIGQTLPKEIQIESVDLSYYDNGQGKCILQGQIAGSKDLASGSASSYLDLIRASPKLMAAFDTVKLSDLKPTERSNSMNFEIELALKPAGKGKK